MVRCYLSVRVIGGLSHLSLISARSITALLLEITLPLEVCDLHSLCASGDSACASGDSACSHDFPGKIVFFTIVGRLQPSMYEWCS